MDIKSAQEAKRILSKAGIESAFTDTVVKKIPQIFVFDELSSSNQWLLDNLRLLNAGEMLCIADSQTSGRGRAARDWHSPAASNIYMSFTITTSEIAGIASISLVIGLALVRSLSRMGVNDLALKWPNDVLLGSKKLAGVLIETKKYNDRIVLVVGIGINVDMPAEISFQSELGWADLSAAGLSVADRNDIVAQVYAECEQVVNQFMKKGFSSFRDEWESYDAFMDKGVSVINNNEVFCEGVESGLDDSGRLLIKTDAGVKPVHSGDVSLRKKHES